MSGQRIFTTWFTSTVDQLDHAVTDEEFMAHRPRPEAVCGAVVMVGPLAYPPRSLCPRCVTFLRARQTLRDFPQLEPHRHAVSGLLAHVLRLMASLSSRRGRAAAPRPLRSRRAPSGGMTS
jgi:hypothetical protein